MPLKTYGIAVGDRARKVKASSPRIAINKALSLIFMRWRQGTGGELVDRQIDIGKELHLTCTRLG